MRTYISYFKLRFITSLQYRAAAISGLSTQFFFGMVYIMVYLAFMENGAKSSPMNVYEIVSYLWLNQSFFALINMFYKDKELFELIRTGNVAYELCRPQKLYFMWYAKIIAQRLSAVALRCVPVFVVAFLLPYPYRIGLPLSIESFLMFLLTLITGMFLMTAIVMIYHVITFFTLDEKGVTTIFISVGDLLSGLTVPIPFFPKVLQIISMFLPFKYVSDLPFRLYTGNISVPDGFAHFGIQLIWIAITITIGLLITNKALKRVAVQGG